jgi:transcriptional regulator with XRE-family HTH domain
MNPCMTNAWDQESMPGSDAPAAPETPRRDIIFAWTIVGTSGWSALDDDGLGCLSLLGPGTHSGWLRHVDAHPSQSVLAELRSKTQLTWAQLARALGVQRRSLHFWARGERPSAANLERLMRILGIVRAIDRGDPAETTAFLFESLPGRPSPFALLCEGRDEELLEFLRPRQQAETSPQRRRRPPRLSPEERDRRQGGVSPLDRLDALHDDQIQPIGKVIATIAIPRRRD